jgi:hypothetical protein
MSTMNYIRCQNPDCRRSNPVKEKDDEKEYTCIFCGHPFTLPGTQETKQVTGEELEQEETYIPDTLPVREPVDRNQRKPVNRNKSKPLR